MPRHDEVSTIFQIDPIGIESIQLPQNVLHGQQIFEGVELQNQGQGGDWQKLMRTRSITSAINTDQGVAPLSYQPPSLNPHMTNPTGQGATISGCSFLDIHNQTSMQSNKETLSNESVITNGNVCGFLSLYAPWEGLPTPSLVENTAWQDAWILGGGTGYTAQQVNLSDVTPINLGSTPHDDEEARAQRDQGDDVDGSLSAGQRSSQSYSPTPSLENSIEFDQRATAKKVDKIIDAACAAGPPGASHGPSRPRKKLTVEQKRSNHIRYEKRRRALIRDRFNALAELLPGLDGENCSKSRTLFSAVEQLQVLLEKNKALQEQVDMLKRDE